MRIVLGGINLTDTEVLHALPEGAMVVHAPTIDEVIEDIYSCSPDILVVEAETPELWSGLQQISNLLPVPVVIVARHEDANLASVLANTDIFAYMIRPLTSPNLCQAITIACTQFQRLTGARNEAVQLREAFAARKIIDRAKGLLMQRYQISEAEAYSHLREDSRRQRIPILDTAMSLLDDAGIAYATGTTFHAPSPSAGRRAISTTTVRMARE